MVNICSATKSQGNPSRNQHVPVLHEANLMCTLHTVQTGVISPNSFATNINPMGTDLFAGGSQTTITNPTTHWLRSALLDHKLSNSDTHEMTPTNKPFIFHCQSSTQNSPAGHCQYPAVWWTTKTDGPNGYEFLQAPCISSESYRHCNTSLCYCQAHWGASESKLLWDDAGTGTYQNTRSLERAEQGLWGKKLCSNKNPWWVIYPNLHLSDSAFYWLKCTP